MEAISRLVKRKIRKEQISPPTDFLHVKHVGPAVGNELNAIFMGQQGALPVAGVSMKTFGRPLPATPSDPAVYENIGPAYENIGPAYENIGPAYENIGRELRESLPLGEEMASGRVVIHVERSASGRLIPPYPNRAPIPPPVPPHAPPPIPPRSRPTARPSGDLAHEPQALAYPAGRIGPSSMPAAAPSDIAAAGSMHDLSSFLRGRGRISHVIEDISL